MPQESIYEMYYEALAFNNTILEIWITVTFATILSIYISSPHITRFLRWLIVGLYSMSSFVLMGRLLVAVVQIGFFRELAATSGYEELPGNSLTAIVGTVYVLLVPTGTLATLYFALTFTRKDELRKSSMQADGDRDT